MAWGETPSTEVLFENLENSETSEDVRKQTRALLNEARLQIKEFHNAKADDLHKAAVDRYNVATEKLVADIKSDNEFTAGELGDLKWVLWTSLKLWKKKEAGWETNEIQLDFWPKMLSYIQDTNNKIIEWWDVEMQKQLQWYLVAFWAAKFDTSDASAALAYWASLLTLSKKQMDRYAIQIEMIGRSKSATLYEKMFRLSGVLHRIGKEVWAPEALEEAHNTATQDIIKKIMSESDKVYSIGYGENFWYNVMSEEQFIANKWMMDLDNDKNNHAIGSYICSLYKTGNLTQEKLVKVFGPEQLFKILEKFKDPNFVDPSLQSLFSEYLTGFDSAMEKIIQDYVNSTEDGEELLRLLNSQPSSSTLMLYNQDNIWEITQKTLAYDIESLQHEALRNMMMQWRIKIASQRLISKLSDMYKWWPDILDILKAIIETSVDWNGEDFDFSWINEIISIYNNENNGRPGHRDYPLIEWELLASIEKNVASFYDGKLFWDAFNEETEKYNALAKAGLTQEDIEKIEESWNLEEIANNADIVLKMSEGEKEKFKELLTSGASKKEINKFIHDFRKNEILYIQDEDTLLEVFTSMRNGEKIIPKWFRLSDIAPELRSQSEVIKNFPWNLLWMDILLIPEACFNDNDLFTILLKEKLNDPGTINRLLYRSLNIKSPRETYDVYIKVFESATDKQKDKLWRRVPPVISEEDTKRRFWDHLAGNQEEFLEGMQEIDQILTRYWTDALKWKDGAEYRKIAEKTIKEGKFWDTENLKYAISQFPKLAKLALEKNPNNIIYLPTELRSNPEIISAWIDAIENKDSEWGLKYIHLLVLETPEMLKFVYEKVVEKFWNNEMTTESVKELIKKQTKFETTIRSLYYKQDNKKDDEVLNLLYSSTIDHELSEAMIRNDEIKKASHQDYHKVVQWIISRSIEITSPHIQKIAESNIDILIDTFQDYEADNIETRQKAIATLIEIFWPKDAKIFLIEFANTSIELKEKEIEQEVKEGTKNWLWKEVEDFRVIELLSMNHDLKKETPNLQKIDAFIEDFVIKKSAEGITNSEKIKTQLLTLVSSFDITDKQKTSLYKIFNNQWEIIGERFIAQNALSIIDRIESWESLENIYKEDLIEAIASWKLSQKLSEWETQNNTPEPLPAEKLDWYQVQWTPENPNLNWIPITPEEAQVLNNNPEAQKNFIDTYEAFDKSWLKKLWDIRDPIFRGISNTKWSSFNTGWDFINKNELKVLFDSILISINEPPLSSGTLTVDGIISTMERRNGTNESGEEAQVNSYWETRIEEEFLKRFFPKWSIMFHQEKFQQALNA